MKTILAESVVAIHGGGDGLIQNLFHLLIFVVCLGIIYWLGTWVIGAVGFPPVARKIWDGLFIFLAAILAINFLMGLGGHAFIAW